MKVLHELANHYHIALKVLHHDGKAAKFNADYIDNASGSAGLVGTADTVWNIRRARGEKIATLSVTGREIPEQELTLRREEEEWTLTTPGTADVEITEGRAEILEALDAEHLFPSEILNRLAGDDRQLRQRVERNFYRLAKTGILAKDAKGRYYRVGSGA
jgi:hypothetical protein